MRFNIAQTLIVFGGLVTAGLVAATGIQSYALNSLRINGPQYTQIIYGKDLVADILPPPLFVVESYSLAQEAYLDPSVADANLGRIKELQGEYEARRAYWATTTLDSGLRSLLTDKVLPSGDQFWTVMTNEFVPLASTHDAAAMQVALADLRTAFHKHREDVLLLVNAANTFTSDAQATAETAIDTLSPLALTAAFASIALFLGGLWYIRRRAILPLDGMKAYMALLAEGDYSKPVPFADQKDEIGAMSQSVAVFRDNAMERQQNRLRTEQLRQSEIEREREDFARKAKAESARALVINSLTTGLDHLAAGDLQHRIDSPFAEEYESLRAKFNDSIDALYSTMTEIAAAARIVRSGAGEISHSTEDLAKRTEQQAASLEETASALDQITATVRHSADRANEANQLMNQAKSGAEKSASVVKDAVTAMEKIAESSSQISHIINVIDGIAFQTNLLALNAGVEAARAGEAGRGFAVVAQEVRELAGRSANAAREIKTLIENSVHQVSSGVALVHRTGEALDEIGSKVIGVSSLIETIVTASGEQSSALAEVNAAVNRMDQVTQQNAAMAEQTNSSSRTMQTESVHLQDLVARFNTGDAGLSLSAKSGSPKNPASVTPNRGSAFAPARPVSPNSRPVQSPARALASKIAGAFGASGPTAKSDGWDEF